MLSINVAFKKKTDSFDYGKRADIFFASVDRKAVDILKEKGYSSSDIESYISRNNITLLSKSEDECLAYLKEIVGNEFTAARSGLRDIDTMDEIYMSCIGEKADGLAELYQASELNNLTELYKAGYDIPSISRAFDKHSLFAQHFPEGSSVLDDYKNRIFSRLSKEIMLAEMDELEYAETVYSAREKAILKKYQNSSGTVIVSEIEEASIYVSMMMTDKISIDTLVKLFDKNSPRSEQNEFKEYLFSSLEMTRKRYQAIESAPVPNRKTGPMSAYMYYAKNYIQKNNISLLCGRDDIAICQSMIDSGYPASRLAEALGASPVAAEPCRKTSRYIAAISAGFDKIAAKQKISLDATRKMFDKVKEDIDSRLKREGYTAGVSQDPDYYNCIVVAALLKNGHTRQNAETALAEKNSGLSRSSVSAIMLGAITSIKAEQTVMAYELPEYLRHSGFMNMKIKELEEKGVTIKDLYYSYIKERMRLNPSVGENLINKSLDIDIAEFLVNTYDDLKKEDLIKVIREASPRAYLAGIPADYADKLVADVSSRVKKYRQRDSEFDAVLKEYVKQHGLASEGIMNTANDSLAAYQDGFVAISMMRQNFPFFDVRNALLINKHELSGKEADDYVDGIMAKAEEVIRRLDKIADYHKEHTEIRTAAENPDRRSAEEAYMSLIHNMYYQRGFVQSTMDIKASARCLASGLDEQAVRETVRKNSPVAAEPGRDSNYVDYCIDIAKDKIRKEQEKLEHFRIIPRKNPDRDIRKEYIYVHNEVEKTIDLPWNMAMDVIVASALLQHGFEALDVNAILTEACVKRGTDVSYVQEVMERADAKLKAEARNLNIGQVKVLERTIEISANNSTGN